MVINIWLKILGTSIGQLRIGSINPLSWLSRLFRLLLSIKNRLSSCSKATPVHRLRRFGRATKLRNFTKILGSTATKTSLSF